MTDSEKGAGGSQHEPPWSVDVLADLHAGVLDPAESARLWPLVNTDPQARAVLDALDSVKVGLGQLGNAPVEPMPAPYAARLDAALQAEMRASGRVATATEAPPRPPMAPVVDLAAARKRRNRMTAWGAGVLTAAAAAAAIAFVGLPGNETGGTPQAGDTETEQNADSPGADAEPPMALSSDNLSPAIGMLSDEKDYGQLEDEQGLRDCLDELGITAGDTVGVSPVAYDGRDAIAALLGAGAEAGKFRLVVVEPTCSEALANTELG